ncbi:MAG: hypothetical protein MOB07_05340 [Acidobacteria bacterium]|nr:hypothetical protein [Acidobacteriota bacterium]
MKNLVLVLALLLSATIPALAQNITQSRIVDINGAGVPDVTIAEMSQCASNIPPFIATAKINYVTDANGNFSWPKSAPSGGGSSCAQTVIYSFSMMKEGYTFTRRNFGYRPFDTPPATLSFDTRLPLIYASNAPVWRSVSAASYDANPSASDDLRAALTTGMIAAGFGSGLAEFTEFTGAELPETLANRRILVRDSAGIEKPARLFFVAPTQINYLMPEGLQDGAMVIKLMSDSNELIKVDLGLFGITSPGVFTANSDGGGVPAAFVTRVKPGNEQFTEPVAQLDVAQGRFVPLQIDLGPETEFVVLTLFGTGWRRFGSLANTKVTIGGVDCPVEYVGLQPNFLGVDQINARLPRALIGKGEVDGRVTFAGRAFTNTVKLNFK